ncbi:dTDP-4-dehydrorhamnose reductase [Paenibacillus sp. H1-7]|uniref:dTDP-4-dehydrorhamnose reductase n=1 Tax=Paenibacillus sp. H1-7 TaxID=2282849 RepID=UPI001EF768AB|nr:dTDP-4-dehydrorhamnose reductase [Paenibacillus sp. H1-7]ULL17947.1 dTDP-4-dehydrorhamnose reductase [Paenibacillus sp. H1-7]
MKVLITGAGGQLGHDLIRVLSGSHQLFAHTRTDLNIADEQAVYAAIRKAQPDIIINAAAHTNVDLAEQQANEAYLINSIGTNHVARAAAEAGAKLVHISTDYVFDGSKRTPYTESDRPNPINIYGNSKLHAEKFVELACERYFILRTSWLYGRTGSNFVTKVASLARQKEEISVVDDQFGSPTYTLDLARFIEQLMQTDHYGLYHASNRGYCSRFEFAQEILRTLQLEHVRLVPVSSDAFVTPAERPAYSVFDDEAIRRNRLPRLRPWKEALVDFLLNDYNKEESKS